MRIGIVGAVNEAHSVHMKALIERRGAETLIIDTIQFPQNASLSVFPDRFTYNGRSIYDINVYYVRSVFYSEPPYDLEERRKEAEVDMSNWYLEFSAERERQSHLASWLLILSLKGKFVVNPVDSFDLHYVKNFQVHLLKKNGIAVPPTLVTNDPGDLKAFIKSYKSVVYKPVAGGASCRRLDTSDLTEEKLGRLKNAPVMFQQEIAGDNIRVYVLEDRILSSNVIYTDAVDFRGNEKAFERVKLPEKVKRMCVKAVRVCGMKFSGVDVKRDPKGNYALLECNPSAMFIGYSKSTGDPVDEYLADYLVKKAKSFR